MRLPLPTDTFLAYADGSCLGNPGRGGWAYLLITTKGQETASGADPRTTNNVMELLAAIRLLERLKATDAGVLRCDSQYVVKGITEWREGWIKRGWRGANKKLIANIGLWQKLSTLVDNRPLVRYEWVKAHASDPLNNEVDEIARMAATTGRGFKG